MYRGARHCLPACVMCCPVCAFILCTLRDNSLTLHWFKRSDRYLSGSGVGEQNRTSATPVSEDCCYAALILAPLLSAALLRTPSPDGSVS